MEIVRVSSASKPNAVAGALASIIKKGDGVEIQAIGAAAVNQAIKAVAIARGFLAPTGVDLSVSPAFLDLKVEDQSRTGIKMCLISKNSEINLSSKIEE